MTPEQQYTVSFWATDFNYHRLECPTCGGRIYTRTLTSATETLTEWLCGWGCKQTWIDNTPNPNAVKYPE